MTIIGRICARLAAAAAVAFLAAAPAMAQEPDAEKAAAIRELLDVLNVKSMMGAIAANAGQGLLPMTERMIEADKRLAPEQKAKARENLRRQVPKVQADLQRLFSDPKTAEAMEKMMVRVYGKVFTTPEVRDITAFYRSPTGQKMQRSMPAIMQESMKASADLLGPLLQEMAERMVKELSEGG